MHVLVMPFSPRFLVYTIAIAGTVKLATLTFSQPGLLPLLSVPIVVSRASPSLAASISCRRGTPFCAITRSRRVSNSCWRKSGRRCASTSSKTKSMGCRSAGTNAQSSINAPRTFWIRGRCTQYDVYADGFEGWAASSRKAAIPTAVRPASLPEPLATARAGAGSAGCAFFGSVEDGKCHQLSPLAGPRCSHAPAGITLPVGPQDSNRAR